MNSFWSITLFWAAAAAAVALALAFVLPFLMRNSNTERTKAARRDINLAVYRDQMKDLNAELSNTQLSQEQFLASKLELETRAAEDALAHEERAAAPVASRRLGFTLAAVLPAAAIGLYVWLGNPGALIATGGGQDNPAVATQPTEADILQMIQRIEARAQANPTDSEAWEALATANAMMARWPEALQAYQKTLELLPTKPAVLSGYAEALAMTSNMLLAGRPIELVNMALQTDPNDRKGLELAGIHAYQNKDFARAVEFLDRLQRLMTPESPYAQEILKMRNEAQRLAQLSGGSQASGGQSPSTPDGQVAAPQLASVAGSVDVATALQSRVGAQSTIYLIARAGESGPPLAAARVAMGPFPLQFSLDDSMAMNPANTLSNHREVVVVARISASGNPIAQPGDLEGRVMGVVVGAKDVKLVIDRVLP
ncbi:MAG: c-type cytochrome biogenesis protein CcmI [Hydrogenophaga sp.]|uniref:c-type cytochrome biogenesis protein CcmI n=1 Tax=Hydrogenophaga sp. TaxID=1904254 RepID=UPI00272F0FBC|nr:c-type cytochrome biogenesis protein CcmI [Hydrogenophaga sp.]MDP2164088.1 c-type cytochrome biogenesis protein CcmI [Hydrogenophaga sp.]MDP3476627.1 c-type cytochrome biogenesis protein CcmI [Hydrogenophaga sp.]